MGEDDETDGAPDRTVGRRALLGGLGACAVCAAAGFGVGRLTGGSSKQSAASTTSSTTAASTASPTSGPGAQPTDARTSVERRADQPDGLFSVNTDEPIVAMTFDDGPDPMYTPDVMSMLQQRGMNATFFTIGVNAVAYPDLVQQHLDAGNSIANHTYDHPDLELLPDDLVNAEIIDGQNAIIQSGAPAPLYFRPPKGFTDEAVGVIADTDQFQTVFWDLCLEHFVLTSDVPTGVATMLSKVKPGSILLAHDGGHVALPGRATLSRASTMQALPLLLDGLQKMGLTVVDVPTLVKHGTPS